MIRPSPMAAPVSPAQHVAAIPGVTSAVVTEGRMLVGVEPGLDATTVALRAAIVLNALGAGLPVEVTGGRRTPPAPALSPTRWAGLSMTNAARVACAAVLAGSAGLAAISNVTGPLAPIPPLLAGPLLHRGVRPPPVEVPPVASGEPPIAVPAAGGPAPAVAAPGAVTVAFAATPPHAAAPPVQLMVVIHPLPPPTSALPVTPPNAPTPTPAVEPRPAAPTAPTTPGATTGPTVPQVGPPQVVVASTKPPVVTPVVTPVTTPAKHGGDGSDGDGGRPGGTQAGDHDKGSGSTDPHGHDDGKGSASADRHGGDQAHGSGSADVERSGGGTGHTVAHQARRLASS